MKDYVEKMIEAFPEDLREVKIASTPVTSHLFQVREDVKKLSEKDATIFHNIVAKGLF